MYEAFRPRAELWKRYLIGTLLIVFAAADRDRGRRAQRGRRRRRARSRRAAELDLGGELAEADVGKPQTIMLIGSDQRAKDNRRGRRVRRALGHADPGPARPAKKRTALLSLPRDLKVEIPGHGTDKINAAYSLGGPKLTLKTVKQLTGLRINHVINVDFERLPRRRSTRSAASTSTSTAATSTTTSARRATRRSTSRRATRSCAAATRSTTSATATRTPTSSAARASRTSCARPRSRSASARSISDRASSTKIFGRYTDSDIRNAQAVLRLLQLAVGSASNPIVEVHFKGEIGAELRDGQRRADAQELAARVPRDEGVEGPARRARAEGPEEAQEGARRASLDLEDAPTRRQGPGARRRSSRAPARAAGLLPDAAHAAGAVRRPAARLRHQGSARSATAATGWSSSAAGSASTTASRARPGRTRRSSRAPSETKKIGKRKFELYYDGDRVRLVAWRTPKAVYWVSNTLLQTLIRAADARDRPHRTHAVGLRVP